MYAVSSDEHRDVGRMPSSAILHWLSVPGVDRNRLYSSRAKVYRAVTIGYG